MYLEEIKEQEQNGSEEKTSKSQNNEDSFSKSPVSETQPKNFSSKQDNTAGISISTSTTSPTGTNIRHQSGFSLIGSPDFDSIAQGSPKKQRNSEMLQSPEVKLGEFLGENQSRDGYSFMGSNTNFMGGFGQYPIGEIGRFDAEQFAPRFPGNGGVSLSLGLPHCENLSLSGTHQSFLPNQNIQLGRRVELSEQNEFGAINPSSTSSAAFDSINIQNRKRFAAQLLPDFVT